MKILKALIIEDSENDEKLLLQQLAKAGYDVQSNRVQTPTELEKAFAEREWDIILSEYALPGLSGLDALQILKESGQDIPFILVSGTIEEDTAVETLRLGANDYLMKYNLRRLVPAIEREVNNAASRRAQQRAEEDWRLSEAGLANAQRIAHIGSWDNDLKNNRLFWSDEVYRIFGRTRNRFETTCEAFFKAIHPDDRQPVRAATDAAIAQTASFNIEHRIIRPDDEERTVCEIGEVTFDESGRPVRFTGTVQDITERKLTEDALEKAMKRERAMVENSLDVICTIDAQGIFASVNPASLEVWGYMPEDLIGRSYTEFIIPEDLTGTNETVLEIMSGASVRDFENRYLHKNGSIIDVRWSASWSEIESLIFCVAYDVTGRKRIENENALLIAQVEHQHQRLNNIIANVPGIVWEVWGKTQDAIKNVDFVSDYVEKMLGYTVSEWLTTPDFWLFVIHPEDRKKTLRQTVENFKGNRTGAFEVRMIAKDGHVIWTEVQTQTITDHENKTIGIRGITIDITERKHGQEALRQAEDKYRSLVELSPAVVYLAEPHPPFSPIYVSPNISRFGYATEEWFSRPDMWVSLIHEDDRARVLRATEDAIRQGTETELEYRIVARDGTVSWHHDKGYFVLDEEGNKKGWQGVILDITKNKELEEQLRQSQKLESVGLLAGGIAHDFNNMLTAINGYSDLALRRLKADDPLRLNIEEIRKAGQRSADLTQQLLAFSRRQILQPVVLDLNEIIGDTTKMLNRLIGEDVQLTTRLNSKACRVKVDPGQISQIIMNLAVNARDAMPQGGELTIETSNIFFDEIYTRRHVGILPGAYVQLAVSDNGVGMSEDTQQHIFEPFFTTKEVGHGTGLGLATVYGIVKQSGGDIEVYSEKGFGTTFKIYLPRIADSIIAVEKTEETSTDLLRGTETIFLVEDEEMVRHMTREILEECGYNVIEAENGAEALNIFDKGGLEFHLLMTDVVMPQMGGRELAEKLNSKFSNLRILYTSGYTDDAVVRHGVIEAQTNFIQKPYTFDNLAIKVRELLDAGGSSDETQAARDR